VNIRYENTLEDVVAFNLYHCDRSPEFRRMRARSLGVVLLLLATVVTAGLIGARDEPTLKVIIVGSGLALAAVMVLIAPGAFRRSLERRVRRMYRERGGKGDIGPHELEPADDALVERTPLTELRTRYQPIERAVSDEGYTFIYLSATAAHIIPHGAVSAGDPAAFIEALRQRMSSKPG
jgi:hypothetical protein